MVAIAPFVSCKKDVPPTPTPPPPPEVADTVQLKIRPSSIAGPSVIAVSPTSETADIVMLKYSLTALNGDINLQKLPIDFVCSGATEQIIDHATLVAGGEILDDALPHGNTVLFNNIDFDLTEGDAVTFTVLVTLRKSFGNYAENTTVRPSIDVSGIKAEDMNGDNISDENIKGTAVGNTYTLLSEGVVVRTISTNTTSEGATIRINIVLGVSAFGDDQYIGKRAILGETITDTAGFAWVLEDGLQPDIPISASIVAEAVVTTNAVEFPTTYKIEDGTTKQFTISVTLTGVPTPGNLYRLRVVLLKLFTNHEQIGSGTVQTLIPFNEYRGEYFRFN